MKDQFDKIVQAVWGALNSKDMKAFYWLSFAQVTVHFLEMFQAGLTNYDTPEWFVVAIGLLFSRLTKTLNKKYGLK